MKNFHRNANEKKMLREAIDKVWDSPFTYNPGGRKDGKKDKSHKDARLHGFTLVHTYEAQTEGRRYGRDYDNPSNIQIAETVVVCMGWSYAEARCVKKSYHYSSGLKGWYIGYTFQNVKKDGTLGKKYWNISGQFVGECLIDINLRPSVIEKRIEEEKKAS
jgi:hypothetical protein